MPVPPYMRYLICYDVVENPRRQAVARFLEDLGFRVQFSVFECRLTPLLYRQLCEELLARMDLEAGDRLHCYPLCGTCTGLIERHGKPLSPAPDEDAFIF